MTTGFVWDERYGWGVHAGFSETMPDEALFEPWPAHETPESKRRVRNLVEASGLLAKLKQIPAHVASDTDLLRVHSQEYLDKLRDTSKAGGGEVGPIMRTHRSTWDISRLAVGGVISAVRAVIDGEVDNAYALVRPPGHHAQVDEAQGFCYLANIAVAARWAQAERGLKRIAVVDWDVHHGNGTQAIFWEDPSVLTISIHQDGYFPPDRGRVEEVGEGAGHGFDLNIPIPPGCGHGAYMQVFDRVVVPALTAYKPELIIIACGFDASNIDQTSRMMLHSESFRAMAKKVKGVAENVCGGRLVFAHEGGYAPTAVPYMALAVLEEISGEKTKVVDPFLARWSAMPGHDLLPHQSEYIERAAAQAKAIGLA